MNQAVVRSLRRSRRGVLVLALVALSFIVLRPACAAFELSGEPALPATAVHAPGGDHQSPCCSTGDDAASVAAKKPAATDPGVEHVAPSTRPQFRIALGAPMAGGPPPAAPPRSLDYHARSARILR
ncbi:MAG TPA: hypothetical protein VLF42_02490 [Burkholderiales bacterium]|nr:hypothetical protein [Burkholderiales bacterium]